MKNNLFPVLVCLTVSALLSGCFGIRPAAVKSPKTMYETFYTEKGTLYFIKPVELNGENESLIIDFTFRNKPLDTDSAIVNFSVISPVLIKSADEIFFKNSDKEINSFNTQLLFNEKAGKQYLSRFSTKISEPELKDLFSKADWTVEIVTLDGKHVFSPKKGTRKIISKLGSRLFFTN